MPNSRESADFTLPRTDRTNDSMSSLFNRIIDEFALQIGGTNRFLISTGADLVPDGAPVRPTPPQSAKTWGEDSRTTLESDQQGLKGKHPDRFKEQLKSFVGLLSEDFDTREKATKDLSNAGFDSVRFLNWMHAQAHELDALMSAPKPDAIRITAILENLGVTPAEWAQVARAPDATVDVPELAPAKALYDLMHNNPECRWRMSDLYTNVFRSGFKFPEELINLFSSEERELMALFHNRRWAADDMKDVKKLAATAERMMGTDEGRKILQGLDDKMLESYQERLEQLLEAKQKRRTFIGSELEGRLMDEVDRFKSSSDIEQQLGTVQMLRAMKSNLKDGHSVYELLLRWVNNETDKQKSAGLNLLSPTRTISPDADTHRWFMERFLPTAKGNIQSYIDKESQTKEELPHRYPLSRIAWLSQLIEEINNKFTGSQ